MSSITQTSTRWTAGLYRRRRDEIFNLLGINEFAAAAWANSRPGCGRRFPIARTIIHDPDVIVFDEPTVGLDVITAKHIIELIRSCKQAGKTVIFSTHIMGEVSLLSDDLGIIHNGKLCYSGTYEDFRKGMQRESLEEEFIRLVEEASL